eukprot:m.161039 g.161039  ORF g.161039 m.161039 type:complete len:55 (+) comp15183_c0_seq1:11553-11717(+)
MFISGTSMFAALHSLCSDHLGIKHRLLGLHDVPIRCNVVGVVSGHAEGLQDGFN